MNSWDEWLELRDRKRIPRTEDSRFEPLNPEAACVVGQASRLSVESSDGIAPLDGQEACPTTRSIGKEISFPCFVVAKGEPSRFGP